MYFISTFSPVLMIAYITAFIFTGVIISVNDLKLMSVNIFIICVSYKITITSSVYKIFTLKNYSVMLRFLMLSALKIYALNFVTPFSVSEIIKKSFTKEIKFTPSFLFRYTAVSVINGV